MYSFYGDELGVSGYSRDGVPSTLLDKMVNNMIFTFNPDFEHAENIMIQFMNDRIEDINKQLENYNNKLSMLKQHISQRRKYNEG